MRPVISLTISLVGAFAPPAVVARAPAQDDPTTVVYRSATARAAIEDLAKSLGKSVAFDIGFPRRPMADFDAQGVSHARALEMLLRRERLLAVDVGGVLVVTVYSGRTRANYSPERIAACHIASGDERLVDLIYANMPVQDIVTSLAQSMSRKAVFETEIPGGARSYSFSLRNVTRAHALQVLCLVGHLAIRQDGDTLVFSAAGGQP